MGILFFGGAMVWLVMTTLSLSAQVESLRTDLAALEVRKPPTTHVPQILRLLRSKAPAPDASGARVGTFSADDEDRLVALIDWRIAESMDKGWTESTAKLLDRGKAGREEAVRWLALKPDEATRFEEILTQRILEREELQRDSRLGRLTRSDLRDRMRLLWDQLGSDLKQLLGEERFARYKDKHRNMLMPRVSKGEP